MTEIFESKIKLWKFEATHARSYLDGKKNIISKQGAIKQVVYILLRTKLNLQLHLKIPWGSTTNGCHASLPFPQL